MNQLFNSARAEDLLKQSGVDGIIAALPENWLYLTGVQDAVASTIGLPTVALLTRRPAAVRAIAIPRLIAGFVVAQIEDVDEVVLYGDFPIAEGAGNLHDLDLATQELLGQADHAATSLADAVELIVRRTFGENCRIAADDPAVAQIVQERLPGCRVEPGRKLFEKIRAVKTPAEIGRLASAARIVEDLEALAFEHVSPGRVWDDFVRMMPSLTAARGGTFGFFSGGSGWRSGYLFPPGDEPLRLGDLVRLDITIASQGYWADSGRTACVGQPDDLTSRRYRAIRFAVEAALDAIRPGVRVHHVYEVAMTVARREIPEYRRRHCGHSIGLRPYDGFLVAPDEDVELEPNMVLNIEVPYYGIGWGGLQLEDTVVVTKDGYTALTAMSRDLVTVPA